MAEDKCEGFIDPIYKPCMISIAFSSESYRLHVNLLAQAVEDGVVTKLQDLAHDCYITDKDELRVLVGSMFLMMEMLPKNTWKAYIARQKAFYAASIK